MPSMKPIDAHWEHGNRCHGLWRDDAAIDIRVAYIGLPPRVFPAKVHGYSWSMDWPNEGTAKGTSRTLREAKSAATKAWNEKVTAMRGRKVYIAENHGA